jgi:hypothetical protein
MELCSDQNNHSLAQRKPGETRAFQAQKNTLHAQAGLERHKEPLVFSGFSDSSPHKSARSVPAIQAGRLRGVMFAKSRVAARFVLSLRAGFSRAHPLSDEIGCALRYCAVNAD